MSSSAPVAPATSTQPAVAPVAETSTVVVTPQPRLVPVGQPRPRQPAPQTVIVTPVTTTVTATPTTTTPPTTTPTDDDPDIDFSDVADDLVEHFDADLDAGDDDPDAPDRSGPGKRQQVT